MHVAAEQGWVDLLDYLISRPGADGEGGVRFCFAFFLVSFVLLVTLAGCWGVVKLCLCF